MDDKIYEEPSEVAAEDGSVKVVGPDSVDVTLSPEAAAETSDRLLHESMKARGQQLDEEKRSGNR